MIELSGTRKEECCENLFIEHLEPEYGFLFGMASESHGYWVEKCNVIEPEIPEVPIPAPMFLMISGLIGFMLVRKMECRDD